jgi:hypothetical protein
MNYRPQPLRKVQRPVHVPGAPLGFDRIGRDYKHNAISLLDEAARRASQSSPGAMFCRSRKGAKPASSRPPTSFDRPDENDRCSASNLQSTPRCFSPLMHSSMVTFIHVDTKWHVWTAPGFQGQLEEELVPGRVRSGVRPCGAVSSRGPDGFRERTLNSRAVSQCAPLHHPGYFARRIDRSPSSRVPLTL